MAPKTRLKWGSSLEAQRQADEAWKKLKAANKKPKKNTPPQPKPRPWLDYQKYINSARWKTKRKKAIAHYGGKCAVCGSTQNLTVHHKTYKRFGREKLKDLEVLCRDCHCIEHENKGYFPSQSKEYFYIVKN